MANQNINNIPKDKPKTGAVQSGVVDLVCWINRRSPFTEQQSIDDAIILNTETTKHYKDSVRNHFDTVPTDEGIFIKPRINYRHVFIKGFDQSELRPDKSAFLNGQEPVYKDEQTFMIVPNQFLDKVLNPSEYNTTSPESIKDCRTSARWTYDSVAKSQSERDITDTPESDIQMPSQLAGRACNGAGVHWRLFKEKPLFRGEDFFVEFRRQAFSQDIPQPSAGDNIEFKDIALGNASLDVRSKARRNIETPLQIKNFPLNYGVVDYDTDGNAQNRLAFDLVTQPYYLIQFGYGSPDHHYVLMLVGNQPPKIVRIENDISWPISTFNIQNQFTGQSGGQSLTAASMMASDWMRITVRNHLGRLVIGFEGPGYKTNPWIVERKDLIEKNGVLGNEAKIMLVDNAYLQIWGGNLKSSFLFGPLQYGDQEVDGTHKDSLTLILPEKKPDPKVASQVAGISTDISAGVLAAFGGAGGAIASKALQTSKSSIQKAVTQSPDPDKYCLWENGSQFIRLRASEFKADSFVESLTRNARVRGLPGEPSISKIGDKGPFSGDAQIIREASLAGKLPEERADFLYGLPIKQTTSGKESRIEVDFVDVENDTSGQSVMFRTKIFMKAGDHNFEGWTLKSCKTPVLPLFRLVNRLTEQKPRWEVGGFECSEHVMHFSESWSADAYRNIEHTGNIKFLLHLGAEYDNNRTIDLLRIKNKAFYIEVFAGYRQGGNPGLFVSQQTCNYSGIPGFYKLFTGVCYGGTLEVEAGQRFLSCQIQDYSQVLKDQRLFNSPFFDGVRDFNAVHHLLELAGFRSVEAEDPGFILRKWALDESNTETHTIAGIDGRVSRSQLYVLPASYARLLQPFFKFEDGSTLWDGLMQIAERAGKAFYFDAHGVAHLDSYFDLEVRSILLGKKDPDPLFWFTTNPAFYKGQQVFNSVTVQRAVGEVHNHIKVQTNTPNQELIFLDDVNWPSVFNPEAEGFLGYPKLFYQREGVFGDIEMARKLMLFYASMYRPPIAARFETYGQPLRPLDIISLDGQPLRVLKVDSNIDPSVNAWWQQIECEWLKPVSTEILDAVETDKAVQANPNNQNNN